MCIRDSSGSGRDWFAAIQMQTDNSRGSDSRIFTNQLDNLCLLYTSDAADERSSVDLGGRRIIKKKKEYKHGIRVHIQ